MAETEIHVVTGATIAAPKRVKRSPGQLISKGDNCNPNGFNNREKYVQERIIGDMFWPTAKLLMCQYTPKEIMEMSEDRSKLDEIARNSDGGAWTAIIFQRLAIMLKGDANSFREFAHTLDRKEGKAIERKITRVIQSIEDLTDDELERLLAERESKLQLAKSRSSDDDDDELIDALLE